jgi:hypothetical protein
MAYGADQLDSEGAFYCGLFISVLAIWAAIAGYPDIRYDVAGLQEMRGQVTEVDTRRSRLEGYTLLIGLATENGVVQLSQRAVGGPYANKLAPGQHIRVWVGPRDSSEKGAPAYPVWQIERSGRVVMPALDVGDRVLEKYLTLCVGLLIPLVGGLYLVGRHLLRHPGDSKPASEQGSST